MPKQSSNDLNGRAFNLVAQVTGETDPEPVRSDGKNPAAVALGRMGGKKGGPARAAALSPERRSEIASKAAKARWGGRKMVKAE